MRKIGQIQTQLLSARNATVCHVMATTGAGLLTGMGSSKRNNGDPFNAAIGERLALARALEDLAKQLRESIGE